MKFDPAITITWMSREAGSNYYVQEHVKDTKGFIEHGPMKEADIEPFIQARRAYYQTLVDDIKKRALVKLGILPAADPAKAAAEQVVQSGADIGMSEDEARRAGVLDDFAGKLAPPEMADYKLRPGQAVSAGDLVPVQIIAPNASIPKAGPVVTLCDCPKETCRDLYNCRHG